MHHLSSFWTLWFHNYDDSDWSIKSYSKFYKFGLLEEFILIKNSLKPIHIQNGMFFIMKNNIKPIWEAEENKLGICISFKVFKRNIYPVWNDLLQNLILETIFIEKEDNKKINGLSISPKNNFSIIKIWLKDDTIKNEKYLSKLKILGESKPIFKKHN